MQAKKSSNMGFNMLYYRQNKKSQAFSISINEIPNPKSQIPNLLF